MIVPLRAAYPSRARAPVIDRVDTAVFRLTYFMHCLQCTFCDDVCCNHGVDVDVENVRRIEAHAEELEKYVPFPREQWLQPGLTADPDFPGGKHTRTRAFDGKCVFLDRQRRGCLLHRYCVDKGIDFHELKPMVSTLFPLTFDRGMLLPSDEASDAGLVCLGRGQSLYRGARDDLRYYFGDAFVQELDGIETTLQDLAG